MCTTTVKEESNKSIEYATQQTNISPIIFCIIIITSYHHNDIIFNKVCYSYIIWIIIDTNNDTYIIHELNININRDNKLNQSRVNCHTLYKTITGMFILEGYDKFDANVNKINHIYQTTQEINNLDYAITVICVSDLIVYQMKKLSAKPYLLIVIRFIHFHVTFKFIIGLYDNGNNVFLVHLTIMKKDDFDLIITLINVVNAIKFQVDYSYIFLIMIVCELLIMETNIFKLLFMLFYNNSVLDIDESLFWYIYFFA